MNTNPLKRIITKQKAGEAVGIYSVCSANEYVIEAAIECAKPIRWIRTAVTPV